jgi:hypothetical protein
MTLFAEILAGPYMFLSGLILIVISFHRCFKGVPLIRPFFILVGLSMIGLSTLLALFVLFVCFLSGVAVA